MNNNLFEEDLLDIKLYNLFENSNNDDTKTNIDKKLYERYMWLKQMNINPNIIHLKENHNLIYTIFDKFNKMLNENNIEYYYTSGILAYLLVNKELERYHHDLDIFVNMEDLEKLESICTNYGFSFERKLGDRGDGTKRVMLKMYYGEAEEIPITLFMYVKENDNSVTQHDYFYGLDGKEYIEKIYNSPSIVNLSFSNEPFYHNNIKYYAITLEALYLSKTGNRPKDIYDCTIFSSFVDKIKLERLIEEFKKNKKNEVFTAENDKYFSFIYKNDNKKKVLK